MSDHCFAHLIERNTPLPSSRSEVFSTVVDGQKSADITVYQGEDDDVRHNAQVGEFFLEGLAAVDRGNEILVRFDLDLDGILKVSATERATGLQKQLTIDNAVTRFRARNREEALARVAAAFQGGAEGTPAAPHEARALGAAPPAADLPAELAQLFARCEQLIAKSQELAEKSHPADAAEMQQIVAQLRGAMGRRSQAEIAAATEKLEELVFYLQDA
jgi:molecular chaperone DnaK